MSDSQRDERDEQADAQVDAVLADVANLDQVPLADHHDRLAQAHEKLHQILDANRQG